MSWKRLRNQELQERLRMRARIIQLIREFFVKEGFLEVETPILVPVPGQEPYLNPMNVRFQSGHSERSASGVKNPAHKSTGSLRQAQGWLFAGAQDDGVINGYLITSPEYAHKKLLAAGFEKTFEITRAFRAGESWGGLHNPEFTILEWYRANVDYTAIMKDVEKMVEFVALRVIPAKAGIQTGSPIAVGDDTQVQYQGKNIDLSSPWERISVAEAFKQYANASLDDVKDEEEFFKIFLTHIEPKLGFLKPTILYDYPASMAALARLKPSPPIPLPAVLRGEGGRRPGEGQVAERFELYIAGIELANAFSELNDATEQRRRFLEEQNLRKKLGKELIPLDEDFLDALENMPPAAGIAFGVDRLVMLLTNAKTIGEVLTFPANELF